MEMKQIQQMIMQAPNGLYHSIVRDGHRIVWNQPLRIQTMTIQVLKQYKMDQMLYPGLILLILMEKILKSGIVAGLN